MLYERGVDSKGFAIIRSLGDKALFNLDTALLKRKLCAPNNTYLLAVLLSKERHSSCLLCLINRHDICADSLRTSTV